MLGEEDLNATGFHSWQEGSRMSSMMAPSLAFLTDGSVAALGSGGSNRIRTAILQVLVNLIDFAMPAPEAVVAPRLHYENRLLNIEGGFADWAKEEVAKHEPGLCDDFMTWPPHNLFFGGVHAATRASNGAFEAVGDPRRGGVAVIE
jgi:gamma-glutamyltranspeptidase/glutathione hydrolase